MTLFKYDLHVHTAEISPCGKVKAEKMVELYKNEGYTGVVVTDHFRSRFFEDFEPDISWEEKIDKYMLGYKKAKKRGEELGLEVLIGLEITFMETRNDYLIYGIDEKFLKNNKNFQEMELGQFEKYIEKLNKKIMIFQAHPFREGMTVVNPDFLDGVEVFNGNPRHDSRNDLAHLFAARHELKKISGSDFHQIEDLGKGGIILSEKPKTEADLVQMLEKQNLELIKKRSG